LEARGVHGAFFFKFSVIEEEVLGREVSGRLRRRRRGEQEAKVRGGKGGEAKERGAKEREAKESFHGINSGFHGGRRVTKEGGKGRSNWERQEGAREARGEGEGTGSRRRKKKGDGENQKKN
jgi:hypothetical protein